MESESPGSPECCHAMAGEDGPAVSGVARRSRRVLARCCLSILTPVTGTGACGCVWPWAASRLWCHTPARHDTASAALSNRPGRLRSTTYPGIADAWSIPVKVLNSCRWHVQQPGRGHGPRRATCKRCGPIPRRASLCSTTAVQETPVLGSNVVISQGPGDTPSVGHDRHEHRVRRQPRIACTSRSKFDIFCSAACVREMRGTMPEDVLVIAKRPISLSPRVSSFGPRRNSHVIWREQDADISTISTTQVQQA